MEKPAVLEPLTENTNATGLVDLYRLMMLIRLFEKSLYRKYREGKIGGYLHRYDGEEALVAGIIPLLRKDDYVLSTYRDHAHALACGTSPNAIMAELMGRATGCAGGKGGSMHLIDPANGFLGGDGIVGGPVPVSVGVGYAIKYRGGDQLCACYFGDGAMNQGGVHEALNIAGLYKLPILFILENNGYAMGTSIERSTGQPDLAAKARAHGVDAERINGMDVMTVRQTAERVIKHIRETSEPYFLEISCYRFVGHGVADNPQQQQLYRTQDEIQAMMAQDPIVKFREMLLNKGLIDDKVVESISAEIEQVINEAVDFAEGSPEPPLDSLYENVFSD